TSAWVKSGSRRRGSGQDSSRPAGPEPPAESQDIEAGQEREGGAPVAEGEEETELEGDCQEMGLGKSGSEYGDGLSVKRKILPNLQCTRILERGGGWPR
uniref:GAGE domain-containing protein n=1 Tax=Theropithecus gelada TaxID=9565 RepID=A0A8D2FHN6_THEGE